MQVIQRYGGRCVLCDSAVEEWIHAAHLAGDAERGSSDPRNGLPLCSNHHHGLDRDLIAIDPDGRVYIRDYEAAKLGVLHSDLSHLPAQPHRSALEHRWKARVSGDWAPAVAQ
jgi:hypothetical protein